MALSRVWHEERKFDSRMKQGLRSIISFEHDDSSGILLAFWFLFLSFQLGIRAI